MVLTSVEIDERLHAKIRELVDNDKIEYPSMGNFINKAIREKIERDLNDSNSRTIN